MADISRNAACPCGSELKYKRCCLGKKEAPEAKRLGVMLGLGGLALLATGIAYYTKEIKIVGLILAVVGVGIVGWYVARNIPPPRSRSRRPGRIDFGR